MYARYDAEDRIGRLGLGELGFSLKPPKWARNLISQAVKATKVKVDVPGMPGGPVVVDFGDPDQIKKLRQAAGAAHATLQIGPHEPTPTFTQQIERAAGELPPWLLPVGIGLVALMVLKRR